MKLRIGGPAFAAGAVLLLAVGLVGVGLERSSRSGSRASEHTAAGVSVPPPAPRRLLPGASLLRRLQGGGAHSYLLHLERGDFVRLRVEQRGIDVVVVLSTPDGRPVVEVDSPNGKEGPEPVLALADSPGDYRLEVRSLSSDAAPGRYRVLVEEWRPARSEDRLRVEGEHLLLAGYRLQRDDRESSLRAASRLLETAADRLARAGGDGRRAEAMYFLGVVRSRLGDNRRAIEVLERALPLFHAAGELRDEANTLNDIGRAERLLGELEPALHHYRRALTLRQRSGDLRGEAVTRNNLGRIRALRGDRRGALIEFRRALDLWRRLGEPEQQATTLRNLGSLYEGLGEDRMALEQYRQALIYGRQSGDRRGEADTLVRLARLSRRAGEARRALERLREALRSYTAVGDRRGRAVVLSELGRLHQAVGDTAEAIELYRRSLEAFRDLGDRRGEALLLHNLGWTHLETDPEAAAADLRRALELFRGAGDASSEILTRFGLARAERRQGHLRVAEAEMTEVLGLVESARGRSGGEELRASFVASNHQLFEFAVDLAVEIARGEPGREHEDRAFELAERGRARSLLDLLAETAVPASPSDPRWSERVGELEGEIDRLEDRRLGTLAAAAPAGRIAVIEREIRRRMAEYHALQAELRGGDLEPPVPARILDRREVQRQLLDGDTLLLEYHLGEQRSFLWALTSTAASLHELPPRQRIEELAHRAHELLTESRRRETRAQTARTLAELSRVVLGPIREDLGKRRVVVVADGALEYVPFAVLPTPLAGGGSGSGSPLIDGHEVVGLPSASVLAALRRRSEVRSRARGRVAVVADPVYDASDPRVTAGRAGTVVGPFPRLPFARSEAAAILESTTGADRFSALGFDANRRMVVGGALSGYRWIHFATHAVLNTEHPDLSGIVLSRVDRLGRPVEGFLRLRDIYDLHLDADLVVLSACRTGLGREMRGEGLVGLTRGFIHAGARRLVVSLWQVSDRATAELMRRFYDRMLREGLTPAAALRAAQLSVRQEPEWAAPYYWAGFVFQGEWR